jgi:cation:H+ antiporter
MLAATLLYAVLSLRGLIDWITGFMFLILFFAILFFIRKNCREHMADPPTETEYPLVKTVLGLGAVILGSHFLLTSAVDLAALLGIPEYVIGLSLVAVGTSLPELATSLIAAMKNSPAISVGNIVGSNIFNILFILGVNSLFTTVPVPGYTDTLVMTGFAAGIFGLYFGSRMQTRAWALVLLLSYGIFITMVFGAW